MAATSFAALSGEFSSLLRLAAPPIGIAFRDVADIPDAAPIGGSYPASTEDGRTGAVSASCVFWTKAVDAAFSTVAEDHGNCSVGSYTHGFKSLGEVADKNDVAALVGSGWVGMEDFPHVPAVKDRPASIVYGPLDRMPVEPDVVYVRLNAKQAMVLDDAMGGVKFEGKPQCHIMAIAKDDQQIAVSVGCMLSRVRTGMSNNELSCAIPAARLGEVVAALRANADTERQVAAYAAADAARFGRTSPH
ncbi:DUF169 domain-containing protein [Chelativorans xinjiangense]|uniref:DUF169 domain-containing protein n=1 Tax=Chelativorans xinjiangense TaxID=2681485 RepID=UPI0013583D8D|nr:DUF169 domain-containing protein [Chelativorans xinjiangense]